MGLAGKVVSGMGQGAKFFSLERYAEGFRALLGERPFFGTLNIDVGGAGIEAARRAKEGADLVVRGFESGGKRYFDVRCARAKLRGVPGLLVFPLLNHHPQNILEFVCGEEMRKKFGLKDGDKVEIEIM